MKSTEPIRPFLKINLLLVGVLLILGLTLDLTAEFSFLKNFVRIVRSAFDINPVALPGSNLTVCTASVTWSDMCIASAALQPTLSWNVTSGTQVAYAVQVDNNGWLSKSPSSSFTSPEVDTGEVPSGFNSYTVPVGSLAFNTTYYWQVAVKDDFGSWSGWTEADSSFTTPVHAWPTANEFTWDPQNISAKEIVTFYPPAQPPAVKPKWKWDIPSASYEVGSDIYSKNPKVTFPATPNKQTYTITLTVSDLDYSTYVCSASKDIDVNLPLPGWQEKPPR